jgi:hypothetical protein
VNHTLFSLSAIVRFCKDGVQIDVSPPLADLTEPPSPEEARGHGDGDACCDGCGAPVQGMSGPDKPTFVCGLDPDQEVDFDLSDNEIVAWSGASGLHEYVDYSFTGFLPGLVVNEIDPDVEGDPPYLLIIADAAA